MIFVVLRVSIGDASAGLSARTAREEAKTRENIREPPSSAPRGRTGRGLRHETGLHLRPRGAAERRGRESPGRDESRERYSSDPETGVAPGVTQGRNVRSRCRCSMCPAIHTNSRSWLRSSSTHEPSDPPLRVVFCSEKQQLRRFVRATDGRATAETNPGITQRRQLVSKKCVGATAWDASAAPLGVGASPGGRGKRRRELIRAGTELRFRRFFKPRAAAETAGPSPPVLFPGRDARVERRETPNGPGAGTPTNATNVSKRALRGSRSRPPRDALPARCRGAPDGDASGTPPRTAVRTECSFR